MISHGAVVGPEGVEELGPLTRKYIDALKTQIELSEASRDRWMEWCLLAARQRDEARRYLEAAERKIEGLEYEMAHQDPRRRLWRDRAEAAERERDKNKNLWIQATEQLGRTGRDLATAREALAWVAEHYPKAMREMPGELFHPLRSLDGEGP